MSANNDPSLNSSSDTAIWQNPCQKRLHELLSLSPAVIYTCRAEGDYAATFISEHVYTQLGYPPKQFLDDPGFWASKIHPDDQSHVFSALPELLKKGSGLHEYRFLHADGSYRWMRDQFRILKNETGHDVEIIGSWQDISDLKQTEQALKRSEAHLLDAQRIAHLGSWEWQLETDDLYWSDEVFRIFGLNPAQTPCTYELFLSCIHPEDRNMVNNAINQALTNQTDYRIEHRIVLGSNAIRYVEEQGRVICDASGTPIKMTGIVLDITARKEVEQALLERKEQLLHQAHYDSLTDLPNRLLLQDRLEQAIIRASASNERVALLLVDLDNFKKINDTLGHYTGDRVLQEAAERLKTLLGEGKTIARLSGDEFVIIIENTTSIKRIASAAQKILSELSVPLQVDDRQFFITGSIGISMFPDNSDDVTTLLKSADISMYAAKKRGRNSYQFYSPQMDARAHELLLLDNDLRQALDKEQLLLHYQPQIDLITGKLLGFEALIRWQHPEKGLIPPSDFIPLAEESGQIIPIGNWILQTACQQARNFLDAGFEPFQMCVNISMIQFYAPDFPELVIETLQQTGLDASALELEITESVAMENPQETITRLQQLHELGIRVAIDDFGTGHSSLSYLKHLPISTLKIDRGFVADVLNDPYDLAIIEAILALAASLQLDVVAEGIETTAQQHQLAMLGCRTAQGYLFCRPQPSEALLEICNDASKLPWYRFFTSAGTDSSLKRLSN